MPQKYLIGVDLGTSGTKAALYQIDGRLIAPGGRGHGRRAELRDYTITIENTGRATLYKYNISDTLLGAISTAGVDQTNPTVLNNTWGPSLAPRTSCTITLRRTVQAGDPD